MGVCVYSVIAEIGHCKPIVFSHHNKELLFELEEIMNAIHAPLHKPPDFVRPAMLSCYGEALHACQQTWRIRALSSPNRGSFFRQTEGPWRSSANRSPSTPPSCPTHQSTPHINSRRTADNGPLSNGGPKASLRLYCSTALGNRRTLDQTQAKMNRNVEHLKNPFSSVARRATVCFKGLRTQWATWRHLWSNKQSPTRDRH